MPNRRDLTSGRARVSGSSGRNIRQRTSITNKQNTLERKLKSSADVERLKKALNFAKIVRVTINIADGYCEMKNVVHHAGLKNIFQELIIVDCPACLDFKNPPLTRGMGVSVETF